MSSANGSDPVQRQRFMLLRVALSAALAVAILPSVQCRAEAAPNPVADNGISGGLLQGWGSLGADWDREGPAAEPRLAPSRRAEPSETCFRKTTTAVAATTGALALAVDKPLEINKKHPSNEYQVYSTSVDPTNVNPLAQTPAGCGDTTPATTKKVETTTLHGDKKVVGEIIDQLKDINTVGKSEAAPATLSCNRDGSWYSEAGGVRLDLVTAGAVLRAQVIESVPKREGVLACEGWNMTGQVPFPEPDAPFILIGINDLEKVVASFVGQCAVCGGRESVVGKWLVVETARDCPSMITATVEVPDIFHRELLHSLKANRLERLNLTDCFPSTPRHTTTTKMPHVKHAKAARRRRNHRSGGRWSRWKRDGEEVAAEDSEMRRDIGGERATDDERWKREVGRNRASGDVESEQEDDENQASHRRERATDDDTWKREDDRKRSSDYVLRKRKYGGRTASDGVRSKRKRKVGRS